MVFSISILGSFQNSKNAISSLVSKYCLKRNHTKIYLNVKLINVIVLLKEILYKSFDI